MKFKLLTLFALLTLFLALTACQAMERLDAAEPAFEAELEADVRAELNLTEDEVAAYEPVFEPVDCWFQMPETQPVDCGYLIVPEDRSDPDSPNIRLAVAILRHPDGNPEPDPIIRLHGGPGGGYLRFMEVAYQDDATLFPANRDVIAFDQRGVGLSEPALECPEVGQAFLDMQDYDIDGTPLTDEEYREYLAPKAGECFDRLSKVANLSMYTSPNSAADVNDLRLALGYEKVNLHGSSYGTVLALHVMRDYPEGIRSVVLDAPGSTDETEVGEVVAMAQALNKIFEGCAADEDCNNAFPNLRDTWLETITRLNEEPPTVEVINDYSGEKFEVLFNANNATMPLRFLLPSTSALGMVPLYIDRVNQGDYSLAAKVWGGVAARFDEYISWGPWLSILCHTRESSSSVEAFEAAIATSPEVADFFTDLPIAGENLVEICEQWKVEPALARESQPVKSQIPTLLIVGQIDPATNFDDAYQVADNLENSYGPYVFPAMGHIVSLGNHDCPAAVAASFIIDPTTEPDTSCIEQMDSVQYVLELGGSGEIELVAYTGEMFEGVVPDGWNEIQPGMFARSNPSVDKTLLAQLAAPAEHADEMLGEVLGEFGLTSLPDPLRTIPTDTLTWKMYLPAGIVPMIIARAETDEATYLIVLIATKREMDALAEEVLLPAVEALTPVE